MQRASGIVKSSARCIRELIEIKPAPKEFADYYLRTVAVVFNTAMHIKIFLATKTTLILVYKK